MDSLKWRFPVSGYGERKGISTGDTEAFKKAPYQAFAREILQNSIDARLLDDEPVRVEFHLFEMPTNQIPGYDNLKNAVRRSKELWKHKVEYLKEYENMEKILSKNSIKCLRISDFNTTGLIGVDSNELANNQFLALTKGTGISEKTGLVSGGSKGMGKNAAFLMSSLKTVFYSTRACYNIEKQKGDYFGSIGVAEFVSGYVDDEIKPNRDYTQGTGYYCSNDLNMAINDLINFDIFYSRNKEEYGTDIYIIGFEETVSWEQEILNSILDSFMASIVRGKLELVFNDSVIDRNTVKDYIYDEKIVYKTNKSNIISQYRLLTDGENVQIFDIDTDYGKCQLYVLPYSKDEEELSTHKCVMIRHPLMKIKEIDLGASFRVSAMCIIGEGKLGEMLRNIENPQHIDWEPKRLKDVAIRREMTNLLNDIKEQIRNNVMSCLKLSDKEPIDPYGAGDFLSAEDIGDSKSESVSNLKPADKVTISSIKENITIEKNAKKEFENGNGIEPEIASSDDIEEGNLLHPTGENDYEGRLAHPGSETSGEKDGDSIVFRRVNLTGVKYKVMATSKTGDIRIVFIAPIKEKKCYLSLLVVDDSNNTDKVKIQSMSCNGNAIISIDDFEYGPFEIDVNQKMTLDVKTNIQGYFASEVKVICK